MGGGEDRDRQTDRKADRQEDRPTDRKKDRKTERGSCMCLRHGEGLLPRVSLPTFSSQDVAASSGALANIPWVSEFV